MLKKLSHLNSFNPSFYNGTTNFLFFIFQSTNLKPTKSVIRLFYVYYFLKY